MKIRKFNESSKYDFNDIFDILKSNLLDIDDEFNLKFFDKNQLIAYLSSEAPLLNNLVKDHKICMIKYKLPFHSYLSIAPLWKQSIIDFTLSIENQIVDTENQISTTTKCLEFLKDFNVAIKRTEEEVGRLLSLKIIRYESKNFSDKMDKMIYHNYFVFVGLI